MIPGICKYYLSDFGKNSKEAVSFLSKYLTQSELMAIQNGCKIKYEKLDFRSREISQGVFPVNM